MKITVFLGYSNPSAGAAWTRIGFLSDFLSRGRHSVEVIGAFSYQSLHKRGTRKLGNVGILNLIFRIGLANPLVFLINGAMSFIVSALILVSRRPDVAIISFPTGDVGLGSLLSSILLKKKTVVDYRDDWEDFDILEAKSGSQRSIHRIIKRIAALMYSKADLTVSVTPTWAETLRVRGAKGVHLIPNGADVRTFRSRTPREVTRTRLQLGLPKNCFVAIFTGTLAKYYMFQETLRSFAELVSEERNTPTYLLVVGNDEEDEESGRQILALSKRLGIENRVIYLKGTRDHVKLGRMIASADVGLIPLDKRRGHVWPAKFFEYCACGIPVIATVQPNSILGKLINIHKVGLTVKANNHIELANALKKIYRDVSFRTEAGKRARQMIIQEFDRNKWAEEFLALMTESARRK